MAVETMILQPAGIVGLGPGISVTGITEILLVAHQTTPAIPGALDPVSLQPPKIIM